MNNKHARELLALRRDLDEARRQLEQLRQAPPPTATSFARATLLRPVSLIPGRVPSGAQWDISHGPAKIYDLLVRSGAGDWKLSEVKPTVGDGPRVELANPFGSPLPADSWVMGIQILGNAWIAISEPLTFIRASLTAGLTTTSTTADVYDVNNELIAAAATIEDPETIFTGLTTGTRVIGVRWGERNIIVNANCPAEEET